MVIGIRIKEARERLGLSQAELGRLAGVSQPVIAELETGEQKTTKKLPEIASALKLSPGDIDPAYGPGLGVYRPPPEFFGERDLKIFASVEGASGEMVVSTDPIDTVPRPWYLKNVKEGYGVIVTGESMVPKYEPGDIVIVNPRLPALRNRPAILVSGEELGSFTATVKLLTRETTTEWQVAQFNPKREFSLAKKTWARALRIVGTYEGS